MTAPVVLPYAFSAHRWYFHPAVVFLEISMCFIFIHFEWKYWPRSVSSELSFIASWIKCIHGCLSLVYLAAEENFLESSMVMRRVCFLWFLSGSLDICSQRTSEILRNVWVSLNINVFVRTMLIFKSMMTQRVPFLTYMAAKVFKWLFFFFFPSLYVQIKKNKTK